MGCCFLIGADLDDGGRFFTKKSLNTIIITVRITRLGHEPQWLFLHSFVTYFCRFAASVKRNRQKIYQECFDTVRRLLQNPSHDLLHYHYNRLWTFSPVYLPRHPRVTLSS